jgi:hypothetical protein
MSRDRQRWIDLDPRELDAALLLHQMEAMSRENSSDHERLGDSCVMWEVPWLVALSLLVRREDWQVSNSSRYVLEVYDGDRPADMSGWDEMDAIFLQMYFGHRRGDALHNALFDREERLFIPAMCHTDHNAVEQASCSAH